MVRKIELDPERTLFEVHFLVEDCHVEVWVLGGVSFLFVGMFLVLVAGAHPQMEKLHETFAASPGLPQGAAQRWSAEILKMHLCYCCYRQHSVPLDCEWKEWMRH